MAVAKHRRGSEMTLFFNYDAKVQHRRCGSRILCKKFVVFFLNYDFFDEWETKKEEGWSFWSFGHLVKIVFQVSNSPLYIK